MSRFMPTCKVFRAKVLYALNREIAMMFWLSDRAVLHQQYNLYAKFISRGCGWSLDVSLI